MAYLTQVGTTTTANTDLVTATLVHTQTNITRIRKLWVNIFADQVKGGGDYIAHITIQRAGAGSFYESIKTTKAAAAGVTSIYFGSIPITLNATDVMKVYLIGLAIDNDTTADVIVDVNEEWEDIDANGRVDVGEWLGVIPATLTATGMFVKTAVLRWLTDDAPGTPAALSANGYIQTMVLRWLTDNAAGTPDALSTNKLPADVKLWLATAPAAVTTNGYLQTALLRWLTDNAPGTPLALTGANLVQADAIKLNGAVPNNLAAGAQMDLINAPNGTAITAIQSGLATLAKLLEYVKALARKDAPAASADIVGGYNNTTDSLEAVRDRGDVAWVTGGVGLTTQQVRDSMYLAPSPGVPAAASIDDKINLLAPGAPITLNSEITEIHTP